MGSFWKVCHVIVVVLLFVNCITGNPISKTPTKALSSNELNQNAVPPVLIAGSNGENINPAKDIQDGGDNKQPIAKVDINTLKSEPIIPRGPLPTSTLPVLGPMLLSNSKRSNEDFEDDRIKKVSKAFTKKVLKAFFDELNNRPDLVDDIVRRETYRLMEEADIGNDDDFNAIPLGTAGLTQDLMPVSDVQMKSNQESEGNMVDGSNQNMITKDTTQDENELSKKSVQDNRAENLVESLDKLQTADTLPTLTGGLGGATIDGNADKSSVSNTNGDDVNDALLLSPYYYYVYYDENEDSAGKTGNTQLTDAPAKNSNNNDGNNINKKSNISPGEAETVNSQDTVVEKLASAVRSVITRDMEQQLAQSKMAQQNGNGKNDQDLGMQSGDVKVGGVHQVGNSKNSDLPMDEEMELTKLAE